LLDQEFSVSVDALAASGETLIGRGWKPLNPPGQQRAERV